MKCTTISSLKFDTLSRYNEEYILVGEKPNPLQIFEMNSLNDFITHFVYDKTKGYFANPPLIILMSQSLS